MTLEIGDTAPDFSLPATDGQTISLSALKGKTVVVYFYPKDDTPGCTQQACDLRDNINQLKSRNMEVIGISKDSVDSHETFRKKFSLSFPLASDESGNVCEAYKAWGEKSMFGKKYMGIIRSTFLIDQHGIIQKIWRNVKVDKHIGDILEASENLNAQAA